MGAPFCSHKVAASPKGHNKFILCCTNLIVHAGKDTQWWVSERFGWWAGVYGVVSYSMHHGSAYLVAIFEPGPHCTGHRVERNLWCYQCCMMIPSLLSVYCVWCWSCAAMQSSCCPAGQLSMLLGTLQGLRGKSTGRLDGRGVFVQGDNER